MARIDRGHHRSERPDTGRARSGVVAGAVAAAVFLGVRDALDPPRRVEVEEVDPWAGGGSSVRVRFHWHPVPWESVAEVLW